MEPEGRNHEPAGRYQGMGRPFRRPDSRGDCLLMIFFPTPLAGALVMELERLSDERGYFARTWCEREFAARGLSTSLVQCSVSRSLRRHTLRGMHWQGEPHYDVTLVRTTTPT